MWDPENEYAIKETSNHVIVDRYGDIMSESRIQSANLARKTGHFILAKKFNYEVMRYFPPKRWQLDLWVKLCERFNIEKFKLAQEKGRNSRLSFDDSGKASRHTGGCIGFHEPRQMLQKNLKRTPTMMELFLQTHLTKEAKGQYWNGLTDDSKKLEFCTGR